MRQSHVIDNIFADAIFQLEKEWKDHTYGDDLLHVRSGEDVPVVAPETSVGNENVVVGEEEDLSALLAECREEFRPEESEEEEEDLSALLAECREEFRPEEPEEEEEDLSALLAECREEFRPEEPEEEEEDLSALLAECREEFRPEESEEEEEDLSALLAECREEFRPEESEEEEEDLSALLAECREEFRPEEPEEEEEDLSALLAECREEFRPEEPEEEDEDLSALLAECREEFRPEESEEEEEDLSALLAECREEFRPEESEEEEEDLSALLAECREEFRPEEPEEEEEDLSALLAECREEFRPEEHEEEEGELSGLISGSDSLDEIMTEYEDILDQLPGSDNDFSTGDMFDNSEDDLADLLETLDDDENNNDAISISDEYDFDDSIASDEDEMSDLLEGLDSENSFNNSDSERDVTTDGRLELLDGLVGDSFAGNDLSFKGDVENIDNASKNDDNIWITANHEDSDLMGGWIEQDSSDDENIEINDDNDFLEPEENIVTDKNDDEMLDIENDSSDFDSDEDLDSLLEDLTTDSSFSGHDDDDEDELVDALNEAISSLEENSDSLDSGSIGDLMESAFDIDSEFDTEQEEAAAAEISEPGLNAFDFGDEDHLVEIDTSELDDEVSTGEQSSDFFDELDHEIDALVEETIHDVEENGFDSELYDDSDIGDNENNDDNVNDDDDFVVGVQTVPVPKSSVDLSEDMDDIDDEDVDQMLIDMGFGGDGLLHNKFGANKEKLLSHLISRFEYLARKKLDSFPEAQAEIVKSINLKIEIDLKFGEFLTDGEDDSLFNLDV